jgi:uncharacterized protein YjbI with pentapeptide repeats
LSIGLKQDEIYLSRLGLTNLSTAYLVDANLAGPIELIFLCSRPKNADFSEANLSDRGGGKPGRHNLSHANCEAFLAQI